MDRQQPAGRAEGDRRAIGVFVGLLAVVVVLVGAGLWITRARRDSIAVNPTETAVKVAAPGPGSVTAAGSSVPAASRPATSSLVAVTSTSPIATPPASPTGRIASPQATTALPQTSLPPAPSATTAALIPTLGPSPTRAPATPTVASTPTVAPSAAYPLSLNVVTEVTLQIDGQSVVVGLPENLVNDPQVVDIVRGYLQARGLADQSYATNDEATLASCATGPLYERVIVALRTARQEGRVNQTTLQRLALALYVVSGDQAGVYDRAQTTTNVIDAQTGAVRKRGEPQET